MQEPSTLELDLAEGAPGFRLQGVELYNWGTFGKKVWSFPIGGENALVTGDIGSGKSTWVDALTTLLVPPQRITYNKAAGAERRERTDKSYLLGEYMSSREERSSYAKPINLRGDDCYSVIVAVFRERAASRLVSLGQLRWLKGGEIQRLYVVSGRTLSVIGDFKDFDGDGAAFKRRLRLLPGMEVFDSFSDYSSAFRAAMGITEKAIDLFNQTISMKTIGDLDDFIRNHMLERTKAQDSVEGLLRNYDNLRSAHDAVARARRQAEALIPLTEEAATHKEYEVSLKEFAAMIDALPYWAISLELPLLAEEEERLKGELEESAARLARVVKDLEAERENGSKLRSAIDNSETGRRIAELDTELHRLGEERDRRRERGEAYAVLAEELSLDEPSDADIFGSNRARAGKEEARIGATLRERRGERDLLIVQKKGAEDRAEEIAGELESLRTRSTSIPARELALRSSIAEAVGADEETLPFAGELVRVRKEDRLWEAAAERVLHSFALGLLVPERLYRKVSAYVGQRDLGDRRLVYYRVPETTPSPERLGRRSLAAALEVKDDTPFRRWLESELSRRADYARCDSMEEFYRENDAVTVEGLLKSGRIRHEKDDRRRVSDPRNYVLGWSNAEKITLLERDLAERKTALVELEKKLGTLDDDNAALETRRDSAVKLLGFASFEDVDWRTPVKRIDMLRVERDELERSSDQLARLREALGACNARIADGERQKSSLLTARGARQSELTRIQEDRRTKRANLDAVSKEEELEAAFAFLDGFAGDQSPILAELQGGWQNGIRQKLLSRRNTVERKDSDVRGSLIRRMAQYVHDFPESSAELGTELSFLPAFEDNLQRIQRDDLPSYESRFHALLRENTLQDIALFSNELENDAQDIKRAIELINRSLRSIEYNRGTYIALAVERREDQDVADFRSDLRSCMENALDDELYGEDKFLQVKKLLDRFASGESVDRNWTEHVTDVRSWFTFTASERWNEDATEKEFYSSSSGKSGGQKEKLAYTILASALAYQYGLGGQRRNGGFRLIVIDEAFGRGSEESTRYGLKLFRELDLQLLLVTPLQKIGVIEDYVSSIHFIANPDGRASEVRTLGIQEYQERKQSAVRRGKESEG